MLQQKMKVFAKNVARDMGLIHSVLSIALFFFLFSPPLFAQEGTDIITERYLVALYRNAGNEIKIINPVISMKDYVTYSCSGAEVLTNENDHRIITLIPYAVKVRLAIYRDSILIGVKEFKVRLIPKPTIKMYADHSLVETIDSQNSPISKAIINFTVKAIPDEMLAKDLPYDARYTVKS